MDDFHDDQVNKILQEVRDYDRKERERIARREERNRKADEALLEEVKAIGWLEPVLRQEPKIELPYEVGTLTPEEKLKEKKEKQARYMRKYRALDPERKKKQREYKRQYRERQRNRSGKSL